MIPENFTFDDLDNFYLINDRYPGQVVGMRLGLTCSLYMRNPQDAKMRLALAKCADQYLEMVGTNIKSGFNSIERGECNPFVPGQIHFYSALNTHCDVENDDFIAEYYGDTDPYVATHYGLSLFASSAKDEVFCNQPAYFRATLPFGWLKNKDGQGAFQALVHQWCQLLKPYHGYAGIGALQSLSSIEIKRSKYLVYPFAKRFPGLEIEHTSSVANMSEKNGPPLKIKGVNWLTALDDICMAELGGRNAFLSELGEGFKIYDYEGGVLIQAGPTPQLGDINQQNIPKHYQKLARKLKPLRIHYPKGWYLIESPNRQQQTNAEATNEWLARFD